ncbi:MAG: uridine kinase [Flavobacteriales bacterium]
MNIEYRLKSALSLIREACTPLGITASLNNDENYGAVFCRDAVMAGIVGLCSQDEKIIQGLTISLSNFRDLQGKQGQIASNYSIKNGAIGKVSFGTLSPKIDSCTWYLIGVALLIKEGKATKKEFKHSVKKTVDLLQGLEYNGKHLVYIPKGGNWADEYIYEGYVLYDQALRAWALALLAPIFEKPKWALKADDILNRIHKDYKKKPDKYYKASVYPGGEFNKFDLAAHAILAIISKPDNGEVTQAFNWLAEVFLDENRLPQVFFPVIQPKDSEWDNLSRFYLYRFKNMPNHFHNGGIWWIWLGWLSVSFSIRKDTKHLNQLLSISEEILSGISNFDFEEYLSADELTPSGTKKLCFTAAGISMLCLSERGFNFSLLKPSPMSLIKEPLLLKRKYFDVSSAIMKQMKTKRDLKKNKLIVAVCGESGSGKSITALCLQKEFEELGMKAVILHQDSYFHLPPKTNHEKRLADISWVGPNEVNLERMQKHIKDFKAGKNQLKVPVVNYEKNKFSEVITDITHSSVLIVEGVYTFLLKELDFKIYMSRSYKDSLERRKERSREAYSPFVEEVLAIEQAVILPYVENADVIVRKDYSVIDT